MLPQSILNTSKTQKIYRNVWKLRTTFAYTQTLVAQKPIGLLYLVLTGTIYIIGLTGIYLIKISYSHNNENTYQITYIMEKGTKYVRSRKEDNSEHADINKPIPEGETSKCCTYVTSALTW